MQKIFSVVFAGADNPTIVLAETHSQARQKFSRAKGFRLAWGGKKKYYMENNCETREYVVVLAANGRLIAEPLCVTEITDISIQ